MTPKLKSLRSGNQIKDNSSLNSSESPYRKPRNHNSRVAKLYEENEPKLQDQGEVVSENNEADNNDVEMDNSSDHAETPADDENPENPEGSQSYHEASDDEMDQGASN